MTAQPDHPNAKAGHTLISVDAMGGDEGPAAVVAGPGRRLDIVEFQLSFVWNTV